MNSIAFEFGCVLLVKSTETGLTVNVFFQLYKVFRSSSGITQRYKKSLFSDNHVRWSITRNIEQKNMSNLWPKKWSRSLKKLEKWSLGES